MTAHETALKFALLKVLSTQIGNAKKAADQEIREGWTVSDRNAAALPGGVKLGSVTLANGKNTARLDDEDSYLEWVLLTHPEEIEQVQFTRVNPGFTERILAHAKRAGVAVDPATGEMVPGVQVKEGDPYPMTKLEPDAAELVAKAWADGSLSELIGSLVQPAVEAGES